MLKGVVGLTAATALSECAQISEGLVGHPDVICVKSARPGNRDPLFQNTRFGPATQYRCPRLEGCCPRISVCAGERISFHGCANLSLTSP